VLRSKGILSGLLASAALVAAFGCALAVVRPGGGEPARWPATNADAVPASALKLPAPVAAAAVVVPSPGALPVRLASAPAVGRAVRHATRSPRTAAPADTAPEQTRDAVTPPPSPGSSTPAAPPAHAAPGTETPRATPTITQTAGTAITATARRAGDAVAPVSPQAGDAVAQTGQAVGDAVGGIGP